jgi:hypothetical protein
MPNKQPAPTFAYQQPSAPQEDRLRVIGQHAQTFAQQLIDTCPAGPELTNSLEWLRICTMTANQSIVAAGLSQGAAR